MEAGQKMEKRTGKHWLLDMTTVPKNPQSLWLPVHNQARQHSNMDWEGLTGSTLIND